MRRPWTIDQLAALQHELEASITATEQAIPNVRPLPPMKEEEAQQLLLTLVSAAKKRPLKGEEAFLIGQLLAVFQQAVEARMLGHKGGRYFVIDEDHFTNLSGRMRFDGSFSKD